MKTSSPSHPSLKDIAVDYIRQGIVSGQLGPGDKIDQDEIAGILGISRLPVREALIELAHKGFVTTIPRRGAFVVELREEDIEDHFEVLAMVFALVSRRAAKEMDSDDRELLRRLHEQIAASDDPELSERLNKTFFQTINQAGSSNLLRRSILQFLAGSLPGSLYTTSPECTTTEALYRDHLLAALEAQDAEQAANVAQEHLRMCERLTLEVLRERGYWDRDASEDRDDA